MCYKGGFLIRTLKKEKFMKKLYIGLIAVVLAFGLFALTNQKTNFGVVSAQDTSFRQARALLEDERNTVDIVNDYGPSVVAIHVVVKGERMSPSFQNQLPPGMLEQLPPQFREFFQFQQAPNQQQPREFKQQGAGSGFVVGDSSEIITNYHVVKDALEKNTVNQLDGATITVVFPNSDEELVAHVVGVNALYDMALLRLENPNQAPSVKAIPISDYEAVVGSKVIAIGNPFGFASTVTTGIVSGIDRSLDGIGQNSPSLIQTDAAINPGNSGGPLLNSSGELIGINTAIIPGLSVGGERGNIGIGFAVPSNYLRDSLANLRKGGFVSVETKPRLGIRIADVSVYDDIRDSLNLNLPEQGIVILAVEEGSAAQRSGLLGPQYEIDFEGQKVPFGGDIIVGVDGMENPTTEELVKTVFSKNAGDVVNLKIWRDGKVLDIPVKLAVVNAEPQSTETYPQSVDNNIYLGITVEELASYPDEIKKQFSLPNNGLLVVDIDPNSVAEQAGLIASKYSVNYNDRDYAMGGDIILKADNTVITSISDLNDVLNTKKSGDSLNLVVLRDGKEIKLSIKL